MSVWVLIFGLMLVAAGLLMAWLVLDLIPAKPGAKKVQWSEEDRTP